MAKTVNVPDELHDVLASMAAGEGLSVEEYVARALEAFAEHQRAKGAILDRIRNRPPADLGIPVSRLIHEGREERDRLLTERWSSSTPRR